MGTAERRGRTRADQLTKPPYGARPPPQTRARADGAPYVAIGHHDQQVLIAVTDEVIVQLERGEPVRGVGHRRSVVENLGHGGIYDCRCVCFLCKEES